MSHSCALGYRLKSLPVLALIWLLSGTTLLKGVQAEQISSTETNTTKSDTPISIEADKATIDEKKGVSTYSGNVILSQGHVKIIAHEIAVISDKGKLKKIVAYGSPVNYTQQREQKKPIIGEAHTIEYFATEKRIVLSDHALLKQGGSEFSGNRIEYDTLNDIVNATGSKSGSQRVRVTIQHNSAKNKTGNSKDNASNGTKNITRNNDKPTADQPTGVNTIQDTPSVNEAPEPEQ